MQKNNVMEKNKNAWEKWKDIAARAATFLARILLSVFYWIFITPFAIVVRTCSDPLQMDSDKGGRWHEAPSSEAEEQF